MVYQLHLKATWGTSKSCVVLRTLWLFCLCHEFLSYNRWLRTHCCRSQSAFRSFRSSKCLGAFP